MLETYKKQETNFWQGHRAVLESFHRSALIAEDVAAPVPCRSGRFYVRALPPLFPCTRVLTAEKVFAFSFNSC